MSGGCFFDNGMTFADFHSLGSTPSLGELLKIAMTGAARKCKKSFNTNGGMLSSPVALLTLTFSSATSVSNTLIMNSAGNSSSACVSTSHVSMIPRVLRFLIGKTGGAILALCDSLSSSVFWHVPCHQTYEHVVAA